MQFDFATAGRIIFGRGTAKTIPELARSLGKRALFVTGRRLPMHGMSEPRFAIVR